MQVQRGILVVSAATAGVIALVYALRRRRRQLLEEPFPLLPICSESTVTKMKSLPLRSNDIFVASYPKSGTTWMQHIVHTLATDGKSPLPHVSDACPFYDGMQLQA